MDPIVSKGFSLIELIVIVVVIVILAGISVPIYYKSKESILGQEAVANLKLIVAAEKIYRMKNASYISCNCSNSANCNNPSGCNGRLKTNLDTQNWAYAASTGSGGVTATAARQGSGGYLDCVYTMGVNDNEPVGSGCP
ncbi:MAG: hypothetical protein QME65_03565 [Candidatus Omnitrophota bacterium]|nr:hypothetical protein [Candidatus Omnitrophota bacterium]